MRKQSAAPLVARREPQVGRETESSQPMPIVTKLPADVKTLRNFVKRRHIPLADMLEVVQTIYPRCDKSLLSKCAHGEETGAMLRGDALKALMVRFDNGTPKESPERRRTKPNRLVCRVTDEVYSALQRRLSSTKLNVQDYIEALIMKDLTEVKAHE